MGLSVFPAPSAGAKEKRIDYFTASGTWTVPTGVTYAIAHCIGGGGGAGPNNASAGGSSIVSFSTAVTARGGTPGNIYPTWTGGAISNSAEANTGNGGSYSGWEPGAGNSAMALSGSRGGYVVGGATVTPGASISVTVGTGGTGSATGGSGYVWIEYYV
jgi:hypothetical protein